MSGLIERDSPNLLEDTFPHVTVPRITFDEPIIEVIGGKQIVFDPAALKDRDLYISDTTFRDGQQARPPYTPEQIVAIYKLLGKLSGPKGIINQTEFFLYSNSDQEAAEACLALNQRSPEVTGWIRGLKDDLNYLKMMKSMGINETGLLTSCSDYHIFMKLKKDRRKIWDEYMSMVDMAMELGIRPRCHLEDVTRADIHGFVVPFVEALMRKSDGVPDNLKVKIRLCDTMGFGVNYPGVELPRSVPKLVYVMTQQAGVPSELLEWHGHNDFHRVLVNGATAWLYGCGILNSTLFGIGERTGNPPLEGAVFEYAGLKHTLDGMDTTVIAEIVEYYESIGIRLPDNYPFVGRRFNATRAGIHADGLRKDERIYNIFDTGKLLHHPPGVLITDKSGGPGVLKWVNDFLGLTGKDQVRLSKIAKIARWVHDQYNEHGRTTAISDDEMEKQLRLHLPEYYEKRVATS